MSRRVLSWLGGGVLLAFVAWAAFKPHAQTADAGKALVDKPSLVTTVLSHAEDVPVRVEAQGTVVALNQVDLRPQVATTVRQVHVQEGEEVKAGQLLFSFDNRADEAKVAQTAAQLAQSQAQLKDAERTLTRSRDLVRQNFISQSALDTAQANVDGLRAAVQATDAALASAKISLSYQSLTAPFSGRTGAIDVHPGSLVQPGTTQALVTITQMDPIAVSFSLPEQDLQRLLKAKSDGEIAAVVDLASTKTDAGKDKATNLGSKTQSVTKAETTLKGHVSFVDNAVDSTTGTIRVKAEFPNPQRKLWPGAFTRVAVDLGVEPAAVILPTSAVQTGPNGQFVFTVKPDSSVESLPVKLGRVFSRDGKQYGVVIGVANGVKVVAEGGQNLRPGMKIAEAPAPSSAAGPAQPGNAAKPGTGAKS